MLLDFNLFQFFLSAALVSKAWNQILSESEECVPLIASRCFTGFLDVFDSTSLFNIDSLCRSSYDRILCSKDIIDSGCSNEDGRVNFDSWMEGLLAVHHYLCFDSASSLSELIEHSQPRSDCFNTDKYLSCIENKTGVTHVADMLHVALNAIECNWVLISFATCSSTAHKPECVHVPEILNEVVHIFIQKTKCTSACVSSSVGPISVSVSLLIALFVLSFFF